jgi:two-component system sensor histidine kinase HydH
MTAEAQDSIKPFRLVKYFSLTALVVIFVSTLALDVFISQRAKTELLQKSEDYAMLVAANLNHQVMMQFVLPTVFKFGRVQLSNPVQYEHLDKVVRNTIHGFKIDRVDIYDLNEFVTYSTDRSLVALSGLGGRDFKIAAAGQSSSRLISRGGFASSEFEVLAKEQILKTYIPMRLERPLVAELGPILGVFEITQDISEDYKTITRLQVIILVSSTVVMCLLFVVLRFIVKRAERIIEKRAEERRRLERQLDQAERLATLGQMVAGVSHEIRNPLGIIGSTAELLSQKTEEADPRKELGKIIVEETARLNGIVTDFLDFARPTEPRLAECCVDEVLERNLAFLQVEMDRRGIQVERDFGGNGISVQADADLLYRAFLNVFVNAIEALAEGGTIRVKTRYHDGQKDNLEVTISDTGPGISDEVKEKIFEPFFTTRVKGTGLGLSIVRNIVESHGGSIRIDSPPREGDLAGEEGGTAVIISLPQDLEIS